MNLLLDHYAKSFSNSHFDKLSLNRCDNLVVGMAGVSLGWQGNTERLTLVSMRR